MQSHNRGQQFTKIFAYFHKYRPRLSRTLASSTGIIRGSGMDFETSHGKFRTDDPTLVPLIESYKWSPTKTFGFLLVSLLTLGLFPLALYAWKRGPSAIIRCTHHRCGLDEATVFLVKVAFETSPVICWPILVTTTTTNNGVAPVALKPTNRVSLSFWRRLFSTLSTDRFIEFVNETDSASAFKVHSRSGDSVRAGIDLGTNDILIWNINRHVFQRFTTAPSYLSSEPPSNEQRSAQQSGELIMEPILVPSNKDHEVAEDNETECAIANLMDTDYYEQELAVNDDKFVLSLYRQSTRKTLFCYLLSLLSCGLLSAIFIWKPKWRLAATFHRLSFSDSRQATHVKIEDPGLLDNAWIRPLWLSTRKGVLLSDYKADKVPWRLVWRFFVFESMPFVLDANSNRFVAGPVLFDELLKTGVASASATTPVMACDDIRHPWARRALCGFNVTPVPLTPIWLIFWREAFSPLYLFQVACCVMWFSVEYTAYASCLLTFAVCTISWSVYMTYTNEHAVWHAVVGEQMQQGDDDKVVIAEQADFGSGFATAIDPMMLVPGDVVFLHKNRDGNLPRIPADLVLLEGSCLIDESMLSGEVTPVAKFPCPNPRREKPLERNMLHSGTKLLCISTGATAMVTSIGFCTTRGRLVRTVLRPTKADLRFTVETIKFLAAMAIVGIIGLTYTVIIRVMRNEDAVVIFIMCGVLAAVVVPPQLSVGLTISLVVAQVRLKARKIFCTNPKSITPTGSVDLVCFDKTGTLTEESVSLKSVLSIDYKHPDEPTKSGSKLEPEILPGARVPFFTNRVTLALELCAASCNSITVLPLSPNSVNIAESPDPIGDPIDLELFKFSQFTLLTPELFYSSKRPNLKVEILKNFGFSPERRSACVVAKVNDGPVCDYYVFVKGAPEHILPNCLESTIPPETQNIMEDAAYTGLRLILLASKRATELDQFLGDENLDQDAIESGLTLCGIAFFENCVKPESRPTIAKLQKAKLRTLIITGDDVRTAVSTARECGIISSDVLIVQEGANESKKHSAVQVATFVKMCSLVSLTRLDESSLIAVTEDSWRVLRKEAPTNLAAATALRVLLERCAVFARFRPEQKAEVVEEFRNRYGLIVAMIGDGANDCCALKAADVGVALTEAEASVASAFTCKNRNVSPLIDILKEGRCSLISTFGLFGVMVSYSSVQFSSMCILYWIQSNFTDFQFLYLDLFLLTTLSLVFPLVPSFNAALSDKRPHRRLLCFGQVAPILVHNMVNLSFQIFVFFYVQQQPWFLPYNIPQELNTSREYNSFESYAVYSISIFQYIWSALVFARGAPFRSRFYQSKAFSAHLVALLIANHCMVIYLPEPIRQIVKVFPPPSWEFRFILLLIAYINLCCCFICVRAVEEFSVCLTKIKQRRQQKREAQQPSANETNNNANDVI